MRKGELINLEWADIDFKNRLVKVNIKDFWEPKHGSARVIPISSKLYEILSNLEKKAGGYFALNLASKLDIFVEIFSASVTNSA
jgi:integrase